MNTKTSTDLITDWLRKEGGRHTSVQIADALQLNRGTTSGALSVAYAETLEHKGAGIYAFRNPDSPRDRLYAWRSSFPKEGELVPRTTHKATSRSPRRSVGPGTKVVLTMTGWPGVYSCESGELVRLQPVEIQIQDITNE